MAITKTPTPLQPIRPAVAELVDGTRRDKAIVAVHTAKYGYRMAESLRRSAVITRPWGIATCGRPRALTHPEAMSLKCKPDPLAMTLS